MPRPERLDSMVLGETEIFGQVKTAYQMALDAGVTAACANKTFQKAFTIGKRVQDGQPDSRRSHLRGVRGRGAGGTNLRRPFRHPRPHPGSRGDEPRHGRALHARGAEGIYVANRSFDRAVELAGMIGGQAIRYDVWGDYLRDIDVVVAATAAPHCIITRETLLPLRAPRKYRSLFLIDISVPRNISPDVADIDEDVPLQISTPSPSWR